MKPGWQTFLQIACLLTLSGCMATSGDIQAVADQLKLVSDAQAKQASTEVEFKQKVAQLEAERVKLQNEAASAAALRAQALAEVDAAKRAILDAQASAKEAEAKAQAEAVEEAKAAAMSADSAKWDAMLATIKQSADSTNAVLAKAVEVKDREGTGDDLLNSQTGAAGVLAMLVGIGVNVYRNSREKKVWGTPESPKA